MASARPEARGLGGRQLRETLAGLIKPFVGPFARLIFYRFFTDFSDILGRLHPRQTRLRKPPNALGVEESSSPRRVPHFLVVLLLLLIIIIVIIQ